MYRGASGRVLSALNDILVRLAELSASGPASRNTLRSVFMTSNLKYFDGIA
jgi:hypothetical protein